MAQRRQRWGRAVVILAAAGGTACAAARCGSRTSRARSGARRAKTGGAWTYFAPGVALPSCLDQVDAMARWSRYRRFFRRLNESGVDDASMIEPTRAA